MNSNFKKILSGLILLGLATGCGDVESSIDTSSIANVVSSIINQTSSNETSSTVDSSSNNDSSSESSSSTADDSSSESSSSTVDDSSSDSSSSTGGDSEVNSGPVTEAQWKEAMDVSTFLNSTIDMYGEMSMSDPSMPFAKYGMTMDLVLKVQDTKAVADGFEKEIMTIEKEGWKEFVKAQMGLEEIDDATADEVLKQMMGSQGEVIIGETSYTVVMDTYEDVEYIEKETDETVFYYNYSTDFEKYRLERELVSFENEALIYITNFLAPNSYPDATYDETKKAYCLDENTIVPEEERTDGIEAEAWYYFENGKIVKIDVLGKQSMDGELVDVTYSFVCSDYGTTTVTLPTADQILECDHRGHVYGGYNDHYHYYQCEECHSILTYEKHTIDGNGCTGCNYFPYEYKYLSREGFDSSFKVELRINTLNNEIVDVYPQYDDQDHSYEYDEETGISKYTFTYYADGSSDYIVREETSRSISGQGCKDYEYKYTYHFYNEDGTEIGEPIEIVRYNESHQNVTTTEKVVDSCYTVTTTVCNDCGATDTYHSFEHNYGEWVDGEKDENCKVISTRTCADCGHVDYEVTHKHNGTFTITNADNREATFSCSDCGVNATGRYYYNGYNGLTHRTYFYSNEIDFKYEFEEAHTFENGSCDCGAHVSVEDKEEK